MSEQDRSSSIGVSGMRDWIQANRRNLVVSMVVCAVVSLSEPQSSLRRLVVNVERRLTSTLTPTEPMVRRRTTATTVSPPDRLYGGTMGKVAPNLDLVTDVSQMDHEQRTENERIDSMDGDSIRETLKFEQSLNHMVRTTLTQFDPSSLTIVRHGKAGAADGIHMIPTGEASSSSSVIDPLPQEIVKELVAEYDAKGQVHYLKRCYQPTSGVRVVSGDNTKWTIETVGPEGIAKTFGGDELYVTFTDDADAGGVSPTAVARVVDLADGLYDLYFLESRSPRVGPVSQRKMKDGNIHGEGAYADRGTLRVEVVHTCGSALMEPPIKQGTSGYIGAIFEAPGVPSPPIGELVSQPVIHPELAGYDVLLSYGDSVMHGLFEIDSHDRMLPNMMHVNKSEAPLNSLTLRSNEIDPWHNKWLEKMEIYVQRIRDGTTGVEAPAAVGLVPKESNAAIIVGSCAWDLTAHNTRQSLGNDYHFFSFYDRDDHMEAIRTLIGNIREQYSLFDVYWLGCSAIHRQKADPRLSWATWYPNNLRARTLDAAQKALMKELDVPVIDMFETTYEIAELYADHVHCGQACKFTFNTIVPGTVPIYYDQ